MATFTPVTEFMERWRPFGSQGPKDALMFPLRGSPICRPREFRKDVVVIVGRSWIELAFFDVDGWMWNGARKVTFLTAVSVTEWQDIRRTYSWLDHDGQV
ncbi:unnamed protein product [Calypogeia fissa]